MRKFVMFLAVFIKSLFTSREEKINTLRNRVCDYYYTILLNQELEKNLSGVKIPTFYIEKSIKDLALEKAKKDLELVIAEKRVNSCYRAAITK